MVKRLVGYSEYQKALEMLDKLSSTLSDQQRDEVDDYLKERNGYTVDVSLSTELEQGNSTLSDPEDVEKEQYGLSWMTALARIELGAMLAAYTKIPRPFEAVRPGEKDIEAFRYLLLDAFRTHYWSLKQDPKLEYLPRSNDIVPVLAYSRRLIMLRSMLHALSRAGGEWTFPETQEISQWCEELGGLNTFLTGYIRNYLQSFTQDMGRESYHVIERTSAASTCLSNMQIGDSVTTVTDIAIGIDAETPPSPGTAPAPQNGTRNPAG